MCEAKNYLFLERENVLYLDLELGAVDTAIADNHQSNARRIELPHSSTELPQAVDGEFLCHISVAGYDFVVCVGGFEGEGRQDQRHRHSGVHERQHLFLKLLLSALIPLIICCEGDKS